MRQAEATREFRQILEQDPVWGAYAIADLQPEFEPHCIWHAQISGDGRTALLLLYTALEPTVLFACGNPDLVRAGIASWEMAGVLPELVYLSIREEYEPVIARWYDNAGDRRPMLRMVLSNPAQLRRGTGAQLKPVRLASGDAGRIQALYTHGGLFTPDAFDPYQLPNGVFFGIAGEDGALTAVGGTHIVDRQAGVAAIGNMYTRPDCRGRGHAGAILAAIVAELCAGNVRTIVLNVDQRNTGAQHLYERHGFTVHCLFVEGTAVFRK